MTKHLIASFVLVLAAVVVPACVAGWDEDEVEVAPDDIENAPSELAMEVEPFVENLSADKQGPIVCVAWPCCGDGVCDLGEESYCETDCPVVVCVAWPCCGDDSCDGDETKKSCPRDCTPSVGTP